jgi:hypothetical protein
MPHAVYEVLHKLCGCNQVWLYILQLADAVQVTHTLNTAHWRCADKNEDIISWVTFFNIVLGARISTAHCMLEYAQREKSHGFRYGEWGGHNSRLIKAVSHIACSAHAVPLIHTSHAAPLPCSDSAVSFVKVRVVAGNIWTASPTVQQIVFLVVCCFYSLQS